MRAPFCLAKALACAFQEAVAAAAQKEAAHRCRLVDKPTARSLAVQ